MLILQKIADHLGFSYNENDYTTMSLFRRILSKMSANVTEEEFPAAVAKAQQEIIEEGTKAIEWTVELMSAAPSVKVPKIKSSPKGERIKVAAENGVRFSYGPVWNQSVLDMKGIALVQSNRVKLIHQALMYGIEDAESLEISDLCKKIAEHL